MRARVMPDRRGALAGGRLAACLVLALASDRVLPQTRWVVCDLTVQVEKVERAAQRVSGRVSAVRAPPGAQCPAANAPIAFLPETPDYQRVLPSRRWPKVGAVATVRYRYLIGTCKHADVCKIEHHSVLP